MLAEKKDDFDEFSLQLSLILMGNRSKEVQTLTQLLYVPLSDSEAEGKEIFGFSCITVHVLMPWVSGLHTVSTALWEWFTSLLKQSELTSLLIQHNQSPDTSIFTLHPDSGSKVRREKGRRKREKERSVRELSVLGTGHRKTKEKQWEEWQGHKGLVARSKALMWLGTVKGTVYAKLYHQPFRIHWDTELLQKHKVPDRAIK